MADLNLDSTTMLDAYLKLVAEKAKRVYGFDKGLDVLSIRMDLLAVHNNCCPLDFVKLLKGRDEDFAHDIAGIGRHLNRETGKLEDCFIPRCAMQ